MYTGFNLNANFIFFRCSHLSKNGRKPDDAVGQAVAFEFRG